MARGGVNKALVQTARLALIARGEHPSIDAVRVEMGNTGSKTTIHRYLRELEHSDSQRNTPPPGIGEELTELVTRLAQRLEEQAQERIEQALGEFDARKRLLEAELTQSQKHLNEMSQRCADQAEELKQQSTVLLATREQLQAEQTRNARLTQASEDMGTRLTDKEAQIRSLEEKHLHARDALEHYRNSVKEQRDQEQRRHEGQVQQVQMELRQAQQSAMVRQEEITQLNRDNERLLADTRVALRELDSHKDQLVKAGVRANELGEQLQHAQTRCALLDERLQGAQQESADFKQRLLDQEQQNRVVELILIKTELALQNLRDAQAASETDSASIAPDQD